MKKNKIRFFIAALALSGTLSGCQKKDNYVEMNEPTIESIEPEEEIEEIKEISEERVIEWFDAKLEEISIYNDNEENEKAANEFATLTQFIYGDGDEKVPVIIDENEVYYNNLSDETQTTLEIKWIATCSKYYLDSYDNLAYIKEANENVYNLIINIGNKIESYYNKLKDKANEYGINADSIKEQAIKDWEQFKNAPDTIKNMYEEYKENKSK